MVLIYSSFLGRNSNGFSNFPSKKTWLNSLLCSVVLTNSRKQFTAVKLYCDAATMKAIQEDGRDFGFTKIIVLDDCFGWLATANWAYTKVYVYSLQNEPFLHIDSDAFFVRGVPDIVFKSRFCFQSFENTEWDCFKWYRNMLNEAKEKNILPTAVNNDCITAANTAVFAVTNKADLPIVKQYHAIALEYIKNQQAIINEITHISSQSCLFEQFFIMLLLEGMGMKKGIDINVLLEHEDLVQPTNKYHYTHHIGGSKFNANNINKIKMQLKAHGYKA